LPVKTFKFEIDPIDIDISELNKGIYFLMIKDTKKGLLSNLEKLVKL